MNLIIDGVEITFRSSLELTQTYSPITNGTLLRTMDGTGIKYNAWSKSKTEITGQGWIPDGLAGIDFSSSVVMDCIAQRSETSSSNAIAITDTVRSDLDPWGLAYVNDQWQNVGSTWADGTLTIDVTSGATLYQARWMPRLTVFCDEPEIETDNTGAVYSWKIYGEEV